MSKNTVYIKPAKSGTKVHLEGKAREFLPEEGAEVDRTNYWVRRINDGSVVEARRPPKPSTSKE